MQPITQDLNNALQQAKQKGLITHTHAKHIGFEANEHPNEPDEPINQTLTGIVSVLVFLLILSIAIAIFFYLRN